MRSVTFPGGETVPSLGQGTYGLGEDRNRRAEQVASVREGVALGLSLIDTAEMYGSGATERFLAEALVGLRDQVFLVSKVYPQNAGEKRLPQACEQSLRRLNTDRLDLYLLHWRGNIPLAETVLAMQALQKDGKIRSWGVSNLGIDVMEELQRAGGRDCATDQILYNLESRGPEFDLIPWMTARDMPVMAYSPVDQGRLARKEALKTIAERMGALPAQVALAWVLHQPQVIAIPKAARIEHVRQNRQALDIKLSPGDLAELDQIFPPPQRKLPLAML